MNAVGKRHRLKAANLKSTLEDFLLPWQIGEAGFEICHGERRLECGKRKSSFALADSKIQIEDFLLALQIGKAGFQICEDAEKAARIVAQRDDSSK